MAVWFGDMIVLWCVGYCLGVERMVVVFGWLFVWVLFAGVGCLRLVFCLMFWLLVGYCILDYGCACGSYLGLLVFMGLVFDVILV